MTQRSPRKKAKREFGALAEEIRQKRTQLDLTQGRFAERLGVSQQTVSDWENGKRLRQIQVALRLARLSPSDRFCPQLWTTPMAKLGESSGVKPFALSNEEKIPIADASQILGLEPFNVYSLVQRRKLTADRTLLGELVISRTELDRALGRRADLPVGPETET